MLRFDHRVSKDIDVSIGNAQMLAYLSPRLNSAAGAGIPGDQEQAMALKFILPLGGIDIIVAGDAIREQPE